MKLEVGDYVRTKEGIEKITCIENNFMGDKKKIFIATDNDEWRGAYNGHLNGFTNKNNIIIKSSKNIIDLIEEGDYVNGNKVIRIETSSYPEDKNVKIIVCCGDDDYYVYYNEDIKSILTKEQFESMAYEVEQ